MHPILQIQFCVYVVKILSLDLPSEDTLVEILVESHRQSQTTGCVQ